jgi:hypothetical protein
MVTLSTLFGFLFIISAFDWFVSVSSVPSASACLSGSLSNCSSSSSSCGFYAVNSYPTSLLRSSSSMAENKFLR